MLSQAPQIKTRETAHAVVEDWTRAIEKEENEGLDYNGELNLLAMMVEEALEGAIQQSDLFAGDDFEAYWSEFVLGDDGEPDMEKIKAELYRSRRLWHRIRLILLSLTGNGISQPWVLIESIREAALRHLGLAPLSRWQARP